MANPFTSAKAPESMAALPPDLAVQQQQLARQQMLAEALRKQSMEPSGGTEMVGGWAVKKSPMEGLAKLAQALSGGYIQKKADEKQAEITRESGKQMAATLAGYASDMQGTPAQAGGEMSADGYGPPTPQTAAVPGNKQAAMARLLQSGNPMLQQFGMQQMLKEQEQGKWSATPHYDQQGNAFILNDKGERRALDGVKARDKVEIAPSGVSYNPYNVKEGAVFNDPNKLVGIGPDGQPVVNQQLVGVKKDIAKSGASNVNNTVSVAGPENQYNKDIGAGLAKDGLGLVDAAKQAPAAVNNARSIIKAIDAGAITGTGADARLALRKAMETVGVVGPGQAGTTQELISGLSKLTLSGVKTSGLGAGQGFTDKDLAFLASATSGTIADTPANLRRVAELSERAAVATHKKGAAVLERWQKDPALRAVSQDTVLDAIPDGGLKPAPVAPAAGGFRIIGSKP